MDVPRGPLHAGVRNRPTLRLQWGEPRTNAKKLALETSGRASCRSLFMPEWAEDLHSELDA
jgi:hypothetical protein